MRLFHPRKTVAGVADPLRVPRKLRDRERRPWVRHMIVRWRTFRQKPPQRLQIRTEATEVLTLEADFAEVLCGEMFLQTRLLERDDVWASVLQPLTDLEPLTTRGLLVLHAVQGHICDSHNRLLPPRTKNGT